MRSEFRAQLDEEMAAAESYKPNKADWLDGRWSGIGLRRGRGTARRSPASTSTSLKDIGRRITTLPQDFNAHKTIQRLLERRREMIETGEGVDWAMAEHARVRLADEGRFPGPPFGPGRRARHLLSAPFGADRPGERAPLHASEICGARSGALRGHQLDAVGRGGAGVRVRLLARRADGARHVGSPVRRLRQWRAGGVRPVPVVGRAQVAAHVGPRLPAAARLRGPGAGAFFGAPRALPADAAPRTTGRSPTARRRPTTSTSCAASSTANSASR